MAAVKITLPTTEALHKAMELVTYSKYGAAYLATQFNRILDKAKVGPEANDLRGLINSFALHVGYQGNPNSAWKGQEIAPSPFSNVQDHLAREAANVLVQGKPIIHEYTIDKAGKFLRNFKIDQAAPAEQTPNNDQPSRSYNAPT